MSDSYPVYRLTQEAYDQLRLAAEEDPESYLDPAIDFGAVLAVRGVSNYVEETEITTNRPIALTPVADGSSPNPESTERRLWRQSLKKPEGAPLNLG